MNQNDKGKRGERLAAKMLRGLGYSARRSQQYCGAAQESADILTDIHWARVEVKFGYNSVDLTSKQAASWLSQCEAECHGEEQALVLWKRDRKEWLALIRIDGMLIATPNIKGAIDYLKSIQRHEFC